MLTKTEAEKLLHALRNGTTPLEHAASIITGREAELNEFHRCLGLISQETGVVKLMLGDYGIGKTFLVQAFKQKALNNDYLVASFQLNHGIRLNKIEDIFYAIMHHLQVKARPNQRIGFDEIFDIWVENLQNAPNTDLKRYEINAVCQELSRFNMNYARAFLSFMRGRIQKNDEMIKVTSAWLSGEQQIPFALKEKYDLVGSVEKSNTIDFLRAFIKLITLLDYKGLIIFVDEIDLLTHERSDLRLKAYDNIKHLIDLTSSGDVGHLLVLFTGAPVIVSDREKGIPSHPALSQRLNTSALSFQDPMQAVYHLRPLNEHAHLELTRQVLKIYQCIGPIPTALTADSVFQDVHQSFEASSYLTRDFLTRLIQKMDRDIT